MPRVYQPVFTTISGRRGTFVLPQDLVDTMDSQQLTTNMQALVGLINDFTPETAALFTPEVADIQAEVADIMETGEYESKDLLIKMLEVSQDEIETLIEQALEAGQKDPQQIMADIRRFIDKAFGPRSLRRKVINFSQFFDTLYQRLTKEFHFRKIEMQVEVPKRLPTVFLPPDVLTKVLSGLIKNAVENTPDFGRIVIQAREEKGGLVFIVQDFGVGIKPEYHQRIFEGFFTTQETLLYATKSPFEFDAGGKGADLLRMKLFADRLDFTVDMTSKRCFYLAENPGTLCPGDTTTCDFCTAQIDCLNSGGSTVTVFFPDEKK